MRINLKKLLTSSRLYAGGGYFSVCPIFRRVTNNAIVLGCGIFIFLAGNSIAQAKSSSLGGKCEVKTTDIASVKIGNIIHAPDINNTLSFSCTLNKPLASGHQMYYCWHIHDAPGGTAKFTYRYATYAKNKNLKIGFNIYSHGERVGDRRTPNNIIGIVKEWTSDTSIRVDDAITIKWEGNQGVNLSPGSYRYDNPKTHFTIFDAGPNDPLNLTNACGTDNGDVIGSRQIFGNTNITVTVTTYCKMSIPTQAAFPAYSSLRDVKPITATLNVDCSAGTHYRVTSNMGLHAIGGQRYMKARSSDAAIAYNIDSINTTSPNYAPVSLTEWTDYGNGTPAGINYDIQLSIPRQPTPPDDIYTDTIVYEVNHIPESGDITDLNNMAGYTVY